MRYLAIYTPDQGSEAGAPMSQEQTARMGEFMDEMTQAGVLLATGGLLPLSANGVRLRRSGGQVTVTDGPFAEAKEAVAGFALREVSSKEHLIEVTSRFLELAGDGETEIRRVMEVTDSPPEGAARG